jgi:hypothetical protein
MKGKAPTIFILICLYHVQGFAQTTNDTIALKESNSKDSSYIKYYDDYLNFTTGWNTKNTKYIISYPVYNARFVFSPKETNQFSLSLDYSFLYLYYSFTPHIFNLNGEDTIKGATNRTTFATGFSVKRIYINFDYQNIKGYYLQNTNEFVPGWSHGDAYVQLPDLRTIQTGMQVAYNFNKNFSISSLASGKEQQLKTAFTFFPMLAYWHIKMKSETNETAQNASNIITANNDINLIVPASVNIVFAKNFYFAVFAGPIVGIDFFKATGYSENGEEISVSGNKLSTGYYARAGVGYTNKKFYAGIDAFIRNYRHQQQIQKFTKESYGVQVYAGTRFDPPGFLRRSVTWLKKKISQ